MNGLYKILGTQEERYNELYRYLTSVKFMDISRERFEELIENIDLVDSEFNVKLPQESLLEERGFHHSVREYWLKYLRNTYTRIFTNIKYPSDELMDMRYSFIDESIDFASIKCKEQERDPKEMRIFVHGAGIGDIPIYLANKGFKYIYYNDIGGSEIVKFAVARFNSRNLYNVIDAPIRMSFDPLGRGIYEERRAYEDTTEKYDVVLSMELFSWIAHPAYTIMNLGSLLTSGGVLSIFPPMNGVIEGNNWMQYPKIAAVFMDYMGFIGFQSKISPMLIHYISRWVSPMKYKEEWIL